MIHTRMHFVVDAEVCDGDGPFDASYGFGQNSEFKGTPEEVGRAVAAFLANLNPEDCREMEHGTGDFSLRFTCRLRGSR